MGIILLDQHQTLASRIDDVIDKKKKRRSNRRTKIHSPFTEGGGQNQAPQNSQNGETSRNGLTSKQDVQNYASNVAVNSLQTFHVNNHEVINDPGMGVFSRSCPVPNSHEGYGGFDVGDASNRQKRFDPHWPLDAVKEALQRGEIFQATLRVNAHNRLEAYCTIEGVTTDILISGVPLQNRAVEGDVVAVKVDPPQIWSKMKGSAGCCNTSPPTNGCGPTDGAEVSRDLIKGKDKVDADPTYLPITNGSHMGDNGFYDSSLNFGEGSGYHQDFTGHSGYHHASFGRSREGCSNVENVVIDSIENLCQAVVSFPYKRPTGRVVAIIEPSHRRDTIVGFLNIKWWLSSREGAIMENRRRNINLQQLTYSDYIYLTPMDPKFPRMVAFVRSLPDDIRARLFDGDVSLETELVAARIDCWMEESQLPQACVMYSFGRGGEVEPRIASILFENSIVCSEFSPESLECLPNEVWQVPQAEYECRKDIRDMCVFTIDPSTATDLDDALSVESLSDGICRVGVHIADVSYFVQPDTALDMEAQVRSTSVYMLRSKLSMLPSLLSENLGSLIPGVDRLAFSIFWDVSPSGDVLDRWVGRTVIRSCCKLSYEHAQDIIDGRFDAHSLKSDGDGLPQLYGGFNWNQVFQSVKTLNTISKSLKKKRFGDGALRLESAKVVFLLDEYGIPYDSMLCERKDSNFLVEELMLLANRTAAEIILRAFPECALLRRHPEPNMRKLRELEAFCAKHGLELDTTSSGTIHRSLENIREILRDDGVLYDILINYATRPMQLAKYFCSGDVSVTEDDRGHYALAVPLYTHFTSPLRRYPDIVVHRTLSASIEAEQMLLMHHRKINRVDRTVDVRCFSGVNFDKVAAHSVQGQKALSLAALKHRIPNTEVLSDVASYCNLKKLATRHVKDAVDKLYMWVLLKNKEILLSEARVLGIGPRFMSIYVQKIAMERRIYYDDVDGLIVEWLEETSTLVLSYVHSKRPQRRGNSGKYKAIEEVALIDSPCNLVTEVDVVQNGDQSVKQIDPSVFPITVGVLSTIPVALHAVGGDDGPLDIAARLYVTSYFR